MVTYRLKWGTSDVKRCAAVNCVMTTGTLTRQTGALGLLLQGEHGFSVIPCSSRINISLNSKRSNSITKGANTIQNVANVELSNFENGREKLYYFLCHTADCHIEQLKPTHLLHNSFCVLVCPLQAVAHVLARAQLSSGGLTSHGAVSELLQRVVELVLRLSEGWRPRPQLGGTAACGHVALSISCIFYFRTIK